MADPTEAHLMEISLYLTEQPVHFNEDQLGCMFCHRGHGVAWEASYRPEGRGKVITAGVCEGCRTKLKPTPAPDPASGILHVDDFIDDFRKDPYARFVLDYFRRSATALNAFWPWMQHHPLFCTWQDSPNGERKGRYRVTGASRLGDIWLATDYGCETGYDHRVAVNDCIDWSPTP